jgi:putative hydrolase of the HAD superfamily
VRDLRAAPLRALCLDLDDTILDEASSTAQGWLLVAENWARACPKVPRELAGAELDRARHWYWEDAHRERRGRLDLGVARFEIIRRALERVGPPAPELAATLARELTAYREASMRLVPGARELLARLRAVVPRIALVTNGAAAPQRAKIERFALAGFFDHIQVEGEFGAGKPDRSVYQHVLERLDAAPEESMMVGDNFICDVLGPLALGMRAAWIDASGLGRTPEPAPRPHLTLRSILELADHLGC